MSVKEMAAQIEAIRNDSKRLSSEIARVLTEGILNGEWAADEQFPTDKELSEQFGISRSIIREAVSCLKYDGLITSRPGAGGVVTSNPRAQVIRMNADISQSARAQRDLFEFRLHLEGSSAQLAALNRTPYDLDRLDAAHANLEKEVLDGKLGVEPDLAFHVAVADATRNEFFRKFTEFIGANLRESVQKGREANRNIDEHRSRVLREHRSILEAIRSGDSLAAKNAAVRHQRNSMISLNLIVGEIEEPPEMTPEK